MRYYEFANLKPFKASVRLTIDKSHAQTVVWAESVSHARRLLADQFGLMNVISVTALNQVTEAKQLDPRDQQIKTLNKQAKQLSQQAKLTKAQQSVTKAQTKLNDTQQDKDTE